MRLLPILIVALLMGGAAAPAVAGPFEEGQAAYTKGDYARAVGLWRPLAEQGDLRAQFNVGHSYELGRGVPQDFAAAMSWYRKAAVAGHGVSQSYLGALYANGQGAPGGYRVRQDLYRRSRGTSSAPRRAIPLPPSTATPSPEVCHTRMSRRRSDWGGRGRRSSRCRCAAGLPAGAHVAQPRRRQEFSRSQHDPRHRCRQDDARADHGGTEAGAGAEAVADVAKPARSSSTRAPASTRKPTAPETFSRKPAVRPKGRQAHRSPVSLQAEEVPNKAVSWAKHPSPVSAATGGW